MSVENVLESIVEAIQNNKRISMPVLYSLETSPYEGILEGHQYFFEGEEDLLHLVLTRQDHSKIELNKAMTLARKILDGVPPALIWMKPGQYSCHFYLGHDELLKVHQKNK